MLFRDPLEDNHAALDVVRRTEDAASAARVRFELASEADADNLSKVLSAIVFMTMSTARSQTTVAELLHTMRQRFALFLNHGGM